MQMNIVVARGERKKVFDKNILAFLFKLRHSLANWGNDLQVFCWTNFRFTEILAEGVFNNCWHSQPDPKA